MGGGGGGGGGGGVPCMECSHLCNWPQLCPRRGGWVGGGPKGQMMFDEVARGVSFYLAPQEGVLSRRCLTTLNIFDHI